MISETVYKNLQFEYGDMASWALWKRPGSTPKSNTGDMSIWDDPNLLNILNPDYVFVGLNGSGKHDGYLALNRPWFNFHSDSPHQQDYKLRYALMDTPLWGSYITDIIKEYQEVDSAKVKTYLQHHPEVIEKNVRLFRQEMKLHGGHPVLIALGSEAYDILVRYFSDDYVIRRIPHYAYTGVNKEQYRLLALKLLEELKPGAVTAAPTAVREAAHYEAPRPAAPRKVLAEKKLMNGLSRKQYVDELAELLKKHLSHEVITDELFFAARRRVRSGIKDGYREDFIHVLREGSNNNLLEIYVQANMKKATIYVKKAGYADQCPFDMRHDFNSHGLLRYFPEAESPEQLADLILEFLMEADRILAHL